MFNCQQQLFYLVGFIIVGAYCMPPEAMKADTHADFDVIKEDVIPDIENTTQKVIRVNPLDLPSKSDKTQNNNESSVFNIQSLRPPHRHYVNSNQMRRAQVVKRDDTSAINLIAESPIVRQLTVPIQKPIKPKHSKKQLHFIYGQNDSQAQEVHKTMPVNVAPGAYPVYYVVSKTNGRFGKYPIKGFRTQAEFMKYLHKNKVATRDNRDNILLSQES